MAASRAPLVAFVAARYGYWACVNSSVIYMSKFLDNATSFWAQNARASFFVSLFLKDTPHRQHTRCEKERQRESGRGRGREKQHLCILTVAVGG